MDADDPLENALDTTSRFVSAPGFFGLSGLVAQDEPGAPKIDKILPPESITIFAVAENQVAHFKAKLIFRLTTPAVDMDDLKLELPNSNLIVYYLQAIIGDTSIYRIGIHEETELSLVYNFGRQSIRSTVQFLIRGSFKYLENTGVGLVTLIFPSLVGSYHKESAVLGLAGRGMGDETHSRDLKLEVHCLLSLPAPCISSIGCPVRSVSPDGCRVFLRHLESRNIWDSVEFSLLCGVQSSHCPNIILHHPMLHKRMSESESSGSFGSFGTINDF